MSNQAPLKSVDSRELAVDLPEIAPPEVLPPNPDKYLTSAWQFLQDVAQRARDAEATIRELATERELHRTTQLRLESSEQSLGLVRDEIKLMTAERDAQQKEAMRLAAIIETTGNTLSLSISRRATAADGEAGSSAAG